MFAFGIARFVRLEEMKRQKSLPSSSSESADLADGHCLVEAFEKESQMSLIRKGIATLGEPEQEIILLMIDEEWGLNQISEHLSMPLGTIKSHVHRAKKNIMNFVNIKTGESYGRL